MLLNWSHHNTRVRDTIRTIFAALMFDCHPVAQPLKISKKVKMENIMIRKTDIIGWQKTINNDNNITQI